MKYFLSAIALLVYAQYLNYNGPAWLFDSSGSMGVGVIIALVLSLYLLLWMGLSEVGSYYE